VIDCVEHRKKAREREREKKSRRIGVGDFIGDPSEARHHGEEQVSYTFCNARNAWD
jgi:hypothetical protein